MLGGFGWATTLILIIDGRAVSAVIMLKNRRTFAQTVECR